MTCELPCKLRSVFEMTSGSLPASVPLFIPFFLSLFFFSKNLLSLWFSAPLAPPLSLTLLLWNRFWSNLQSDLFHVEAGRWTLQQPAPPHQYSSPVRRRSPALAPVRQQVAEKSSSAAPSRGGGAQLQGMMVVRRAATGWPAEAPVEVSPFFLIFLILLRFPLRVALTGSVSPLGSA